MSELARKTRDEFLQSEKKQVVVVLDNVRSGLNVGSIFRTADAFAIEKIVLCGITPKPPHREILKTALGATDTVSWEYQEHCKTAVEDLLDSGYTVLPVEQTDESQMLDSINWYQVGPVALVFGNEVNGVSDEVIGMLSSSVEIPQFGTKHSLNVAVSVGIVLWHIVYEIGQL